MVKKKKNLVKFFQYYLKLFFNQGQRQLEKNKKQKMRVFVKVGSIPQRQNLKQESANQSHCNMRSATATVSATNGILPRSVFHSSF